MDIIYQCNKSAIVSFQNTAWLSNIRIENAQTVVVNPKIISEPIGHTFINRQK